MRTIFFTVEGPILAWMRPGGKGAKRYDPDVQIAYKRMLGWYCKKAMTERGIHEPILGPIELTVRASWPILGERPGIVYRTAKPDLDNIIKGIQDALNKVAWRDDAQVVQYGVCCKVMDSAAPKDGMLAITIRSLPHGPAGAVQGDAVADGPEGESRA